MRLESQKCTPVSIAEPIFTARETIEPLKDSSVSFPDAGEPSIFWNLLIQLAHRNITGILTSHSVRF